MASQSLTDMRHSMSGEKDSATDFKLDTNAPIPYFGHDMRNSMFLLEPGYANLNHGSFGGSPLPVVKACDALWRSVEANPDRFFRHTYQGEVDKSRAAIAKFLSVDKDTCVFVNNVAAGLNAVLRSFEWAEGDIIACTDIAYYSVSLAIQDALRSGPHPKKAQFTLDFPISHSNVVARFREFIQSLKATSVSSESEAGPKPKIVVVIESIASSPGVLLPWKEMVKVCREEGAWAIVDAAHTLGQELPPVLDEVDPDFFIANCSKWLYGKRGFGLLYVPFRNQDMILGPVVPGMIYPAPGGPRTDFVKKFYWSGLYDPAPPLSIPFALKFREQIGGEAKILSYCHDLALAGGKRVAEILGTEIMDNPEKEGELIASMVNVRLPLSPALVKPSEAVHVMLDEKMLQEHQVFGAPFYYQGSWWCRASAQIYNEMEDFERLGNALVEICQEVTEHVRKSSGEA